jgi:MoxR-like ATPase
MTSTPFDPKSSEALAARASYAANLDRELPPYIYGEDTDLILAVRVALATDRPLLLRGDPGSGKSTLAEDIAARTGRRYYERVISSRTTARDLLWTFDAVRRLGDAQARLQERDITLLHHYIEPGVLWWAFDPESAARRGLAPERDEKIDPARDPAAKQQRGDRGAVVLLDEIDKAEPDMPNDLLVPLGAKRFHVTEADTDVAARRDVLLVITTNNERQLPAAFLRRCIVMRLASPDRAPLTDIVRAHFPEATYPALDEAWLGKILTRFEEIVSAAKQAGVRVPGTAELLDAVRAFVTLPGAAEKWEAIAKATLWKHEDPLKEASPTSKQATS